MAIQDIQDFAATLSPSILLTKIKFHILSHLVEHVRRFGPAVLLSTERYESFNRVFRLCSIYSNRQAPSRDIASTFAHLGRCRHIMTGGHWLDAKSQRWICAGQEVLRHLETNLLDAKLLGVHEQRAKIAGTTVLPAVPLVNGKKQPRAPPKPWSDMEAASLLSEQPGLPGVWYDATSVVTAKADVAYVGSEVVIRFDQVRVQFSSLERCKLIFEHCPFRVQIRQYD